MATADLHVSRQVRSTDAPAFDADTGVRFEGSFCPHDISDPFDTVEWELRRCKGKGDLSHPSHTTL